MSGVAAVLSFSRIARDRRVLQQCALLAERGVAPHAIGLSEPGDLPGFQATTFAMPRPTLGHRLATVARQMPAHLPGSLGNITADRAFWTARRHRLALAALRRLRPAFVLANDWPALIVAARWGRESGAPFHYDSHELAIGEFDDQLWWRLVYKPFVTRLERATIGAAASVSAVGPGLAAALQARYGLPTAPAVVRSIPDIAPVAQRIAVSWPLVILYHGGIAKLFGSSERVMGFG